MRRLVVAIEAKLDIDAILAESQAVFGAAAAERYRRLIDVALNNVVADPQRTGVRQEPSLAAEVRLYPLRAANHGLPRHERVGRPRHLLAFTYDAEQVALLRVLHDRMDKAAHLGA